MSTTGEPRRFFASPDELRAWLQEHHDSVDALRVGLYKKATGKPSVTWPELVDQLLCFGWIDGVRRSIDDESYEIRVTPRRPGSMWSARNLERMAALDEAGLVEPPGRAIFEARDPEKTYRYSFEREDAELGDAYEAELRARPAAWSYWQAETPSYRKRVTWWIVSAKREATRQRRLRTLVEDSAAGKRVGPMRR